MTIEKAVEEGALAYWRKFGCTPTLVYAHRDIPTETLDDGVRIEPADNVLKHHWFYPAP